MAKPDSRIRGMRSQNETHQANTYRDARSVITRLIEQLHSPNTMAMALLLIAGAAYLVPPISDVLLVIAALMAWWGFTRTEDVPLKLPIQAKIVDPKTGSKAAGIMMLGNDRLSGKEIWLTNDDARQHMLVLGTTGAGKALPLDAKVHTPTGWKAMGALKVGDLVSTPDGRSAPVLGYYPQGEIEICRITFADGRSVEACPEHLWEVHHKHWTGKYYPGQSRVGAAKPRVLRTSEIQELLCRNKGVFTVRLPDAVEKPVADLPMDPYLLGAMLGDGGVTGSMMRFTTRDSHIAEAVGAKLAAIGQELHQDSYAPDGDFRLRGTGAGSGPRPSKMREILRNLGLDQKASHEKFVPEPFKRGSVAQRWAVVQGLMDTDGTADGRHGALSYCTTSPQLAKDMQELVWSLGGVAKCKQARKTFRDKHGVKREGRPAYIIHIRHPEREKFFTLPRKLERVAHGYQYADSLKLKIVSIERDVRRAEAACIYVGHPDHLFITDNYVVTHNTESLIGFAANALTWSSGFLFCDGKGDVALFAKVYALARQFGREDDLLVLNFMTGNRDLGKAGGEILSNTLNPFSNGSSDSLTQMVVSLMDDAGGDGAMWKGRATAMFTGVMRALVWLREQDMVDLNVGAIRDHLNLRAIIDMGNPAKYPDMPARIRKSVLSYLTSLPGYQEDKGYKQAQTTLDQHGYLEMQFTKILGNLADVYGHIFFTQSGEVDMYDVVLNRRILVIMLPALEKAPDEIANLGKIVVANLKGMMGATLGSRLQGSWEDVVDKRLTNSPSPYVVVLDEVGYYTVEGMALMAAQARSLGFSLVYASQDIPAMKKLNEKEAASIIANTNTKIFMRTEEPEQTIKLAIESAGKGLQTRVGGFDGQAGEIGTAYRDNFQATLTEIDRVNARDIRAQQAGEMTILHQDHLIYGRSFYANPEGSLNRKLVHLSANHFIKVPKPTRADLEQAERIPEVLAKLLDPDFAAQMVDETRQAVARLPQAAARNEEVALAVTGFDAYRQNNPSAPPTQAACAAIANLVRSVGGLGNALSSQMKARAAEAAAGFELELEPEAAEPISIADSFLAQEHGRPSGPPPVDLLTELVEEDDIDPADYEDFGAAPQGFADDMAALETMGVPPELVERPTGPLSRRRPAMSVPVEHGVVVGGNAVSDVSNTVGGNDAVLRMLADLDFDPESSTTAEVDQRIQESLGAAADIDFDQVASAEEIDYTASQSEKVREPVPLDKSATPVLISEFLDALIEEQDGN